MPLKLNYETPQPRPNILFERPPRSVVWCSVIVGICLIGKILAPVLPSAHVNKARAAAARTDIAMLSTAIEAFKKDVGRYPTSAEGFDVLVTPPAAGAGKWQGPYMQRIPISDPWGRPYAYRPPRTTGGSDFDVISYGPDKMPGGGDDISNH